ncbi:MAG TPA: hypothetical protein VGF40_12510 [Thermoanaerobaculia bacterium]
MTRSSPAALVVVLLASAPLAAQERPDWTSKISVHGYLTQAYAISEDHPIFGIPTDGTTGYRDLALQLRYDPNEKGAFVLQLRHQSRGERKDVDDEGVDLDWAFYQRKLSERLTVKAGRIPLPLGIFNEAEGAGTLSPFYQPPWEFYDRQYTSRTLEGVLGSYSVPAGGGWSLDTDAYFGRWRLEDYDEGQGADASDAWGAQVWANTPIAGVRIGAGAYRCTVEPPADAPADYVMLHGSVDADLDRWRFAAEYLSGNLDTYGRYRSWYGQAGYQLTDRLSVHARGTVATLDYRGYGHSVEGRLSEDLALVANYAVAPSVVFKLEGHTNEGFLRDDRPLNLYAEPSRTRYMIASIAATF